MQLYLYTEGMKLVRRIQCLVMNMNMELHKDVL